MFHLSQHAALAGALAILSDLRSPQDCNLTPMGTCTAHNWTRPEPCPQERIRVLTGQLRRQPRPAPYSTAVLATLLRGLGTSNEIHVRVDVNGRAHTGTLIAGLPHPDTGTAFTAITPHGDTITPLTAADVLDLDIHTAPTPRPTGPDTHGPAPQESPRCP